MKTRIAHIGLLALFLGCAAAVSSHACGIQPIRIGDGASMIEVTTMLDEDNGFCGGGSGISLREAVRYSEPGAIILVNAGFYKLAAPGAPIVFAHDVILKGAGAGTTVISGADYSVFEISARTSVTIAGVSIENGDGRTGGAIHNSGSLTLHAVTLTRNAAEDGGAVFNTGRLELRDVVIRENRASMYGGGIYNDGGTVYASNAAFLRNTSIKGGGAYNQFGSIRIENGTILGNTSGMGGGIADYIGLTELRNTAASDNFGGNFSGFILTLGDNFDSDGSGGFAAAENGISAGEHRNTRNR